MIVPLRVPSGLRLIFSSCSPSDSLHRFFNNIEKMGWPMLIIGWTKALLYEFSNLWWFDIIQGIAKFEFIQYIRCTAKFENVQYVQCTAKFVNIHYMQYTAKLKDVKYIQFTAKALLWLNLMKLVKRVSFIFHLNLSLVSFCCQNRFAFHSMIKSNIGIITFYAGEERRRGPKEFP